MRCAVIGGGAWGTALADLLARNHHDTVLWAREPDVVEAVNARQENPRFLKGCRLTDELHASNSIEETVTGAGMVVWVTPSHVLRDIVRTAVPSAADGALQVVASKGIERDTLALMSDVVAQETVGCDVVALSGPSFAAEVAARQPTAVVAASVKSDAAVAVQRAFSCDHFRVYTHADVIGVELGGSLKNVIAVATGIAEGLGLGFNARAALITRGLAEITRLAVTMGAQPLTLAGLAGMGDLVLTCTGSLSRNRALGAALGGGASLEQALAGRETVAEGVTTTRSASDLAVREGVEMPIVEAVARVLFDAMPPRQTIGELMTRELRPEQDR